MNDQLAAANFLFCHDDSATGIATGGKMIGTFQYLAGQLDMAKEAFPTKGYPSPGLLANTRRQAQSPGEAGQPPEGIAIGNPEQIVRELKKWEAVRRRPRELHPQHRRGDPAGAGAREPAPVRPRGHAALRRTKVTVT